MPEWIVQLTQPQATLATGLLNFLGAIFAVIVGSIYFTGKVKDIKSALEKTEKLLLSHKDNVVQSLKEIEERIAGVAATAQEIRADAVDRSDELSDKIDISEDGAATTAVDGVKIEKNQVDQHTLFQSLRENWTMIRNKLETIAADPKIDGRTAAKYARLDRRSYVKLVDALIKDGRLSGDGEQFRTAARLWAAHRNQRSAVSQDGEKSMKELAELLGAIE